MGDRVEAAAAAEIIRTNVEDVLRVKGDSNATALASAISHALYDGREVVLRAIGAGAVNQGIKACAIARGYVAPRGMDLVILPGFATVNGKDHAVSAITLRVLRR